MHDVKIDVISLFILGATVLAFIYHALLFFFSKDKFLIHYLVYLFFTSFFLFAKSELTRAIWGDATQYFIIHNFREAIQILYLTAYFNFIVEAIGISKKEGSFLFRYWKITATLLIGYSVLFSLSKIYFPLQSYVVPFIVSRLFIFTVTGIMLYQSYKLREIKFQQIILYGCTCYLICGVLSFVTNLMDYDSMYIHPLEWLMIGSFIDIIFFSFAIGYRNKKEWESLNSTLLDEANKHIALQQVILEKQAELENERTRIAADMHDDLGSGLTKITYLSQMALQSDTENNLVKIKKTASELVENMSELIWVMKEENNTLEDLATYIKSYAVDYLDNNNIELAIRLPESFAGITVSGNDRRNIFLLVKESLHNIVKHAGATTVQIEICTSSQLKITIRDDGKGLSDPGTTSNGNGLKNMKTRIESLKGKLEMTSQNGTQLVFEIPIAKTS